MSPEEPVLGFSGELTSEDLRRAARLNSGLPRWARIALIPIAVVVLSSLMIAYLDAGHSLTDLLGWVLVVAAVVGFIWWSWRRSVKKSFEANRLLQGTISGTVSASSFSVQTKYGQSVLPWDVFHVVKTSKDLVLLFPSFQQFYLLPRRFFTAEEDWSRFKELARARVPLKARGLTLSSSLLRLVIWVILFVVVILLWSLFRS